MDKVKQAKQFIENLQSYENEYNSGNISKEFFLDRVSEITRAYSMLLSNKLSDKKKLQKEYLKSMDELNQVTKIKKESIQLINSKLTDIGYKEFLKKTGASHSTIAKIRREDLSLRIENLLEMKKKIA